MGVRNASSQTTAIINATLVTTAETIIATTGPINLITDTAAVFLFWMFQLSTGAAASGLTIRLRRGTLVTSPLVNISGLMAVTASSAAQPSGCYIDNPASAADLQYTLTAQQSAATGNGTANDVCLISMVL